MCIYLIIGSHKQQELVVSEPIIATFERVHLRRYRPGWGRLGSSGWKPRETKLKTPTFAPDGAGLPTPLGTTNVH